MEYSVIQEGLVYIDYGPITMTLEAKKEGKPFTAAAVVGAERVMEVFNELTTHLDFLRKSMREIGEVPNSLPNSVYKMVMSVMKLHEVDFTPLAAVAGTTADFAVDAMKAYGADYAIANNGGDIAWSITDEQKKSLNVGLISDINYGITTHCLKINNLGQVNGIATSGFGGRSLTCGIASSVTVLSKNASIADAAATAVANACYCDDPAIQRCLAKEIDPTTDIPDLMVTRSIGKLSEQTVLTALEAGEIRARQLMARGMAVGAVIFIGEKQRVVVNDGQKLFKVTLMQ